MTVCLLKGESATMFCLLKGESPTMFCLQAEQAMEAAMLWMMMFWMILIMTSIWMNIVPVM